MAYCELSLYLYVLWIHFVHTNSKTSSSHWKLNLEEGKIVAEQEKLSPGEDEDVVFQILQSSSAAKHSASSSTNPTSYCEKCFDNKQNNNNVVNTDNNNNNKPSKSASSSSPSENEQQQQQKSSQMYQLQDYQLALNCGEVANFTMYDYLPGISHRHKHPQNVNEPDVLLENLQRTGIDMDQLEKKLQKARSQKPKSIHILNQVGVYWRLRGHTYQSMECFRKILSTSPTNSRALLNLARLLLSLQYLDDAFLLTQRSLEIQPSDQNAWMQHFTLGEILKAYGRYHEAALHFRVAVELNPGFQLSAAHLKDTETFVDTTYVYTLFIVVLLAMGVILGILTSVDTNCVEEYPELFKCQRHFNRAMAMRSIRMSISSRSLKVKKNHMTNNN